MFKLAIILLFFFVAASYSQDCPADLGVVSGNNGEISFTVSGKTETLKWAFNEFDTPDVVVSFFFNALREVSSNFTLVREVELDDYEWTFCNPVTVTQTLATITVIAAPRSGGEAKFSNMTVTNFLRAGKDTFDFTVKLEGYNFESGNNDGFLGFDFGYQSQTGLQNTVSTECGSASQQYCCYTVGDVTGGIYHARQAEVTGSSDITPARLECGINTVVYFPRFDGTFEAEDWEVRYENKANSNPPPPPPPSNPNPPSNPQSTGTSGSNSLVASVMAVLFGIVGLLF